MRNWKINCDDFGMHPTINRATTRLLEGGVVRSCSLMAVGQFFEDAVARFRAIGGKSLGLHLALQGEYSRLPVRPALPAEEVPSLVDERGFLRSEGPPPNLSEALKELRAQVEKINQTGLTISHLDGHMFFYDPGEWGESLGDGVKALAEELRVPLRLRKNTTFIWEGHDDEAARHGYYESLLDSPSSGDTEILLHPADSAEEMAKFSGAGNRRLADFSFFSRPHLATRIAEAGIRIEA